MKEAKWEPELLLLATFLLSLAVDKSWKQVCVIWVVVGSLAFGSVLFLRLRKRKTNRELEAKLAMWEKMSEGHETIPSPVGVDAFGKGSSESSLRYRPLKSSKNNTRNCNQGGFIKAHVALLNMLFNLVPLLLMVFVKAMRTVVLLSVLVFGLALVVSYISMKFMNWSESRKRGRVVSIADSEMFWNLRYSGSRKSHVEQEKRAS